MKTLVRRLLALFGALRADDLARHQVAHRAVIRRADRLLREADYRRAEEARKRR